MHLADLLDRDAVAAVVAATRPTHVFHVAGRLKPDPADPLALHRIHVDGTRTLFDALYASRLRPVVFIAGSAAVYGVPATLPVREDASLAARSPYGISKIGQEKIAFDAMREFGIPVVCTRSFNLVGPGLSPELIASQVARDVVRAERGGDSVLRVGNLRQRRDFLDIRDAVRVFLDVTLRGAPGASYNVCSGRSVPVQVCVDRLLARARVPIGVEVDPARLGLSDVDDIYGATARISAMMRWRDFIPLERSLDDLLDDWRQRFAAGER
jgi:GDP-4-dehydro-6-deoxy-D-mannose reductase